MRILADSGSTKTDWIFLKDHKVFKEVQTKGYNPNHSDTNDLKSIIFNDFGFDLDRSEVDSLYFYGAGCSSELVNGRVEKALREVFPNAKIFVSEDMLAACHALLGNEPGIACILGTGTNACVYDGIKITAEPPSLGYLLGDDGSGSYIGRCLIRDCVYNKMPKHIQDALNFDIVEFKEIMYHGDAPARYLASYAKFVDRFPNDPYMHNLVKKCFNTFIDNFIFYFPEAKQMPLAFVGSIAFSFQDILRECIAENGLVVSQIVKEPKQKLIEYHLNN